MKGIDFMKIVAGFIVFFSLFIQNVFALEVKSEKLKDGIVVNRDAGEGRSEPCRT